MQNTYIFKILDLLFEATPYVAVMVFEPDSALSEAKMKDIHFLLFIIALYSWLSKKPDPLCIDGNSL